VCNGHGHALGNGRLCFQNVLVHSQCFWSLIKPGLRAVRSRLPASRSVIPLSNKVNKCLFLPLCLSVCRVFCLPRALSLTHTQIHTHSLSLTQHLRHHSTFLSPRPHYSRCSHPPRRHTRCPRSIRSRLPRAAPSPPLHGPLSPPRTLPTRAAAASFRPVAQGWRSAPRHPASPTQPIRKPLLHPLFVVLTL